MICLTDAGVTVIHLEAWGGGDVMIFAAGAGAWMHVLCSVDFVVLCRISSYSVGDFVQRSSDV